MACSSRSLQAVLRHRWRCVSLSRSRGLRQGRLGFTHVHSVSPSLLCAAHMLRGSGTRRLATLSIPTLAAVRNVSVSTEIHLHPPTSLTHEGLSQVACPCCGKTLHLLDLRKHFSVHHQELDQEHCQHMCHERIQLYRRTIGTALKREPAGTSSPSSRPQSSPSWMLPTLSAEGYRCQMCVIRGGSFPTRDAFLKHVLLHHPTVDVDAMEPLVPFMPSPTSTTDSSEPIAYAAAQGPTIAPTRKLKNMERQTVEPFRVEVPVHLRGRGVSVPHSLRHVGAPPTTTLADREDGQPLEFSETRFPCELCRKVFGTELDLLNHLAMKHAPNVEAEHTRRASTPATLTESGTTPPPSQEVRPVKVMCDLCDSQKVFTSPSALFAHIRFKHPEKEAAHHVERLVDAHRQTSIAMCPHCSKGFASVLVLTEHIIRHHPTPPKADDQQPLLCIKSSPKVLGPITSKTQWWCNACERGYTSAPALHRHLQARHQYPTQPRPCPACKRTLPDVYALVNHIAAQHPAIDVKELGLTAHCTCTHCSRSFLVPEQLLAHTRRHHHATESSTTGNAEEKGVPANSEPNSHDQPSRPRKVARPLRQS